MLKCCVTGLTDPFSFWDDISEIGKDCDKAVLYVSFQPLNRYFCCFGWADKGQKGMIKGRGGRKWNRKRRRGDATLNSIRGLISSCCAFSSLDLSLSLSILHLHTRTYKHTRLHAILLIPPSSLILLQILATTLNSTSETSYWNALPSH